jgi:hypothetical protein
VLYSNGEKAEIMRFVHAFQENKDFAELYSGPPKPFSWLLQHLLPPNDKFRSCILRFPDTVFYKGGSPF